MSNEDDAKREHACDVKSSIGTSSGSLMAEASKSGWTVISMKDDWKAVYPSLDK